MGSECSACNHCQKAERGTEFMTGDDGKLQQEQTAQIYQQSSNHGNSDPQLKSSYQQPPALGGQSNIAYSSQFQANQKKVPGADMQISAFQKNINSEKIMQDQQLQANNVMPYEPLRNDSSLLQQTDVQQKYFTQEESQECYYQVSQSTQREKRPPYKFKSGAIYEGEWLGNLRDGYGIQIWADGAKYEGDWKENRAHGKGKFWHADGDIYDGDWANDKANGFGVYTHYNGAKYEGQWVNDLQHGFGIETWADGSKYSGNYRDGKKHGLGEYLWSDGSIYNGNWEDNKITGKGIYKWLDGRVYEGEWLNNNMHGFGVYTWSDGRKYEGEYKYDKKHGKGKYYWADGRIFDGEWAYGKQHGLGKYVLPNGQARDGEWVDGKRIRWLDEQIGFGDQKSQKQVLAN